MLVYADRSVGRYTIAVNNASNAAELMSDFSYLEDAPAGVLTLDFTHMAAGLTQETREEYLPGGFGYQPTQQLVEVASAIAEFLDRSVLCLYKVVALLPDRRSKVGSFLTHMHLPDLLKAMGVCVTFSDPAIVELGREDTTRQNLIPLAAIRVSVAGPDFRVLKQIRDHIERVFTQALPDDLALANRFTSVVWEAVDNLIEYGHGGIIGGLYYPKVGEVEITLANRQGGFGGTNPSEEREALIAAYEGDTRRGSGGGNGIAESSRLAMACFGTLLLRSGRATLRLPPDGSIACTTDETGLPTPGACVSIVLQLLSAGSVPRTEPMKVFESVLMDSLERYMHYRGVSSEHRIHVPGA